MDEVVARALDDVVGAGLDVSAATCEVQELSRTPTAAAAASVSRRERDDATGT
jgi:hypothetical protein